MRQDAIANDSRAVRAAVLRWRLGAAVAAALAASLFVHASALRALAEPDGDNREVEAGIADGEAPDGVALLRVSAVYVYYRRARLNGETIGDILGPGVTARELAANFAEIDILLPAGSSRRREEVFDSDNRLIYELTLTKGTSSLSVMTLSLAGVARIAPTSRGDLTRDGNDTNEFSLSETKAGSFLKTDIVDTVGARQGVKLGVSDILLRSGAGGDVTNDETESPGGVGSETVPEGE